MKKIHFFTEEAKEYIFGKDEGTQLARQLRTRGIYDRDLQKMIIGIKPKKFIEYIKKYIYQVWIMCDEECPNEIKNAEMDCNVDKIFSKQVKLIKMYLKSNSKERDDLCIQIEENLNILCIALGQYEKYDAITDKIYIGVAQSFFILNGITDRNVWVKTQFEKADSNKANRETVFIWGFGLNMDDKAVSAFLKRAIRENDFHFRNPYEVVLYYSFKKRLGHQRFMELWNKFIKMQMHEKIHTMYSNMSQKNTLMFKDDVEDIKDENELFIFLSILVDDLSIQEVSKLSIYQKENNEKIYVPISDADVKRILTILIQKVLPSDMQEIDITGIRFDLDVANPINILVSNKGVNIQTSSDQVKKIFNKLKKKYTCKVEGEYSFEIVNNNVSGLKKNNVHIEVKNTKLVKLLHNNICEILSCFEEYIVQKVGYVLDGDIIKQMKFGKFAFRITDEKKFSIYWFGQEFSKVETSERSFFKQMVEKIYKEIVEISILEKMGQPFYFDSVQYYELRSFSADKEFDALLIQLKKNLASEVYSRIQNVDLKPIHPRDKEYRKQLKKDIKMTQWTNWNDTDVLKKIEISEQNCKFDWGNWCKDYVIAWGKWIWGSKLDKNVLGYKTSGHKINRYDIINVHFWCCMYDPDFMEKESLERYQIFKDQLDIILRKCNMQAFYPPDPYEMFIAICIQNKEPRVIYRAAMWEIENEREQGNY